MKIKSTRIIGISAICLSSFMSYALPGEAIAQGKVGAFIQSGDPVSKAFEQGFALANDGKSSPALTIKMLPANAGSSPDAAPLKALAEGEHVPLIMYRNVEQVAPVAPYLTQASVVGFVLEEVNKKIVPLGANIYGFGYSTEGSFQNLAKVAERKLKSYRVCIVSSTAGPIYEVQRKAFSEQWKSGGNTVVYDEKIEAGSAAIGALMARAQNEKCDTLFAAVPTSDAVSLIKTVRGSPFKGKVLVGDTLFASDIAALGKDAEGIFMVQSWVDDAEFKTLYSSKYGSAVDGITLGFAALAYDAANCLKGVGSPFDAGGIKYSMLSNSCVGLTGVTQFSGERMAQRKKRVVTVKNGELTLAE